jgi:hypothetical protein
LPLRRLSAYSLGPAIAARVAGLTLLEELNLVNKDDSGWLQDCKDVAAAVPELRKLRVLRMNANDPVDDPAVEALEWRLAPSVTRLELEKDVRSCPQIVAAGLRLVTAPLCNLDAVLRGNPGLLQLKVARWGSTTDATADLLLQRTQLTVLDLVQAGQLGSPSFATGLRRLSRLTKLEVSVHPSTPPRDILAAICALPALTTAFFAADGAKVPPVSAAAAAESALPPLVAPKLSRLTLYLCDDSLFSVSMPVLDRLALTGPGVRLTRLLPLASAAPRLNNLLCTSLPLLTDRALLETLKQLPSLSRLRLRSCSQLSVVFLARLPFVAPSLRNLAVTGCPAITWSEFDASVLRPVLKALPALRSLELPLLDEGEDMEALREEFKERSFKSTLVEADEA